MENNNKIKKVVNVAGGIIMKDDEDGIRKFLIIQRAADDHWPLHFEFPRGKCDGGEGKYKKNEGIINCLKREIKEETGLDITPIKYIDKFEYLADEGTRKSICYNFLCIMKNPNQKIKLSKEHDDFQWITSAGVMELMLPAEQKKTMLKILDSEEKLGSIPFNNFTKNNTLEEFLTSLNKNNLEQNKNNSGGTLMSQNTITKAKKLVDLMLINEKEEFKTFAQLLFEETKYQEFFRTLLKRFKVKSPAELSDEQKKEFFNAIDKEWKAKKETD